MSKLSEQEFHVQHVDRDLATGDKVEPEQQPVDKIAPLPVSVDWARPNFENPGPPIKLGHVTDKYNATIAVEMSAGDVAKGFLTNCLNCRSFDPDGFQKYLRAAEARNDREALAEIQKAKGAMINFGVVTGKTAKELDLNAEAALRSLGQCRAWSDQLGTFQATHPAATCELFADRKAPNDGTRASTQKYDRTLRAAQGRKP